MSLLRVDASIQGERSASGGLADLVLAEFVAARPGEPVVTRHLGEQPIPSDAFGLAVGAGAVPESERSAAQVAALELAGEVYREVRDATTVVLAFPLYNFGVSQHAKAWIDLVIAGAGPGARVLDAKPTVLLTTRGGSYAPGTPRAGWDHSTDFLRRILVDVWGADLTVVEREFTLVGINPALDQFADAAAEYKKIAEEAATAAGRALVG